MVYITSVSLDWLICTDCVNFGKNKDRFGFNSFGPNMIPNTWIQKFKVSPRNGNRDFCLVQNPKIGEADFKQFMWLRNKLVIAAWNVGREEKLSTLLIPTRSNYKYEQLKLVHNVVDVVECPYSQICVSLLWYTVGKPEYSNAQVQFFARKKENEKFQQVACLKYKLLEVYLTTCCKDFCTKQS